MQMRSPRRQQGFSLIEVMIAVLVLGVGLLGFAMLQTTSLRMAQGAGYRTQATNLATELLDQMRANRLSAAAYASAATFTGSDDAAPSACTFGTGTQSVTNMTSQWRCQVVRALGPGASANVSYAGNVATVTLTWGENTRTGMERPSFTVITNL